MCLASAVASAPGDVPDLEASPDVLSWIWMCSGVGEGRESSSRPALSAVAFLMLSTEETR